MYKDLLKEIVGTIAGEKSKGLVDLLYGKKNVNEFLITKKLKLMINQTRHILYKLADDGLVSFIRKKDSKKGGWYIYYWTLHIGRGLAKYKENLVSKIENINQQIHSKKTIRHYFCSNCQIEMSEENALVHDYSCTECGEVLELRDSAKETVSFEKELAKQEKVLLEIDGALREILSKEEKARQRKLKAEEKKKKKERDKKKADSRKKNADLKKKKPSKAKKRR